MHSAAPQLLTTAAELSALAAELREAKEIALDTEFIGERSYTPRLLLLQLATRERIVLVDPLGGGDLGALFQSIRDSGALVVGHAIKNDLLLFARGFGVLPAQVFDTQIAAAFLGYGDSIALTRLISDELHVSVEKGYTMANWEARPLSPPMLRYAADDVRHLLPLLDVLREKLAARGRAGWAEQECVGLVDPAQYALPNPEDVWLRMKGRRPSGRDAAVLCALAAERERLAIERDVRPSSLVPDDMLFDLAARKPREERDLIGGSDRRRPPGLEKYAARWIAAIRVGLSAPPPKQPPSEAPLSPEQESLVALGMLLIRHIGRVEGIAPAYLRLEPAIADLVREPSDDPSELRRRLGLTGWRADLVEQPLCDLLTGKLRMGVVWRDGKPEFQAT